MDIAAIIENLGVEEGLPREAIRAASDRREELTELFIAEIEQFLALPAADRERETTATRRLFFIFHLLGEWQATAAYGPLARLLRLPDKELNCAIGWSITETAHRVMAGVFDGDSAPLFAIILDPGAEQFARSGMFKTLVMLVRDGRMHRGEVERFLRDCWMNLTPQTDNFVWVGWQQAISRLGVEELAPFVEQAFTRKFIGREVMSHDDFVEDIEVATGKREPAGPWQLEDDEPFGDTIEELSDWHCFSDKFLEQRPEKRESFEETVGRLASYHGPAENPTRDVGRNDPCPCGSGKKFKKCCLN